MGIVMFYHLTRSTAEQTARTLVERAVTQGWRVMIRSPDAVSLDQLDARFWLVPEDGFLPHGQAGGPHDADQPVLLGPGPATNGAKALVLLDGADVSDDEARAMERVWIIFDGADTPRLTQAREMWKRITAAGHPAQYWSEDSGRWEKKAEKP